MDTNNLPPVPACPTLRDAILTRRLAAGGETVDEALNESEVYAVCRGSRCSAWSPCSPSIIPCTEGTDRVAMRIGMGTCGRAPKGTREPYRDTATAPVEVRRVKEQTP